MSILSITKQEVNPMKEKIRLTLSDLSLTMVAYPTIRFIMYATIEKGCIMLRIPFGVDNKDVEEMELWKVIKELETHD